MKFKQLLPLCILPLCFACGDNNDILEPEKPDKPAVSGNNINANPIYNEAYTRLEMPRLHQGNDTILVHRTAGNTVNYIIEWDIDKKSQRWSCYVMNRALAQQNTKRYYSDDNQYPHDPLIPQSMQWNKDPYYYNGQKLDHGHICPSADRLSSFEMNYQTFFLTNMQPQFNAFNAGLWAKLEKKVRTIASTCDTLYVCKGGTIDEGKYNGYNKVYRRLSNGLIMPRYFFMAMLRQNKGQYSAIGIWTDQINNAKDSGQNLLQYAISIDELEQRTGIDFFCNLPDDIENKVERSYGSSLSWGL
ncbi:DNA/RNA non-specific endonuclease [Hallella bergensis]|uniref:DNA/RNA non-specific endonuclease n=1 Tax=Hallella bergensis TaxID=242750 RepID=UPI0023F33567|nr:DNA/RNA non-specific endonuclease [Hallella bergensis]